MSLPYAVPGLCLLSVFAYSAFAWVFRLIVSAVRSGGDL